MVRFCLLPDRSRSTDLTALARVCKTVFERETCDEVWDSNPQRTPSYIEVVGRIGGVREGPSDFGDQNLLVGFYAGPAPTINIVYASSKPGSQTRKAETW